MAILKVEKVVSSLPVPLEADAIYAVRVGDGFDLYISDSTGSTARALNATPIASGFSTGDVKFSMRQVPEDGWIFATGTIGNASSSASNRAHADCEALFKHIWIQFSVTYAPVTGGRGGSAAADWAANKQIQIPDARGRILCAQDNMGGSSASRVTVAGSGVNGTIPGVTGGEQNVTLTAPESGLPLHSHYYTDYYGTSTVARGTAASTALSALSYRGANTNNNTALNAGEPHSNMPPVLILPLFVKL